MSHPQPPQRQPTPTETDKYVKALHTTAIVTLVACPVLALLPPRKLDMFTFGLAGGSIYSANFLLRESTGRSILQHLSGQQPAYPSATIDSAQALQDKLRQDRQEALRSVKPQPTISNGASSSTDSKGWVAERDAEVKEALEEGKGLQDMIMDQIWDVWNWGKTKEDED